MNWGSYAYVLPIFVISVALALALSRDQRLYERSELPLRREMALLTMVLLSALAIVYLKFFVGDAFYAYSDIGSDTLQQYVPFYLNLIERVGEGSIGFWEPRYGLGVSTFMNQAWAFDPFNLILVPACLILGTARLSLVLVVIQALKVLACGLLFDRVLARFCRLPLARVTGAALFSLNGFLILWGQHYWFGTAFVLYALMLLQIERLLGSRSASTVAGLALSVALTLAWSVYCGFMILLFCVPYVLLRGACACGRVSLREYVASLLPVVASVAMGIACSCAVLLPASFQLLSETGRISGAGGASALSRLAGAALSFASPDGLLAIASRFMGNYLMCGDPATLPARLDTNLYEFVQIGCSVGVFVLLFQFADWCVREAPVRVRVLVGVSAFLVALYCVNGLLPALFNAGVAVAYRSSFVLVGPICIAMAIALERRVLVRHVAKGALVASLAATFGVLAASFAWASSGRPECILFAAMLVALACVMVACGRLSRPRSQQLSSLLICALLVASSTIDAFFSVNRRGYATSGSFPMTGLSDKDADTREALEYVRSIDGSLYRVEKTYHDWAVYEDSLAQGYEGVSAYNSTTYNNVFSLYDHLWPDAAPTSTHPNRPYQSPIHDFDRPALLSLLDVRYILSKEPLDYSWCERLASFGVVSVYRNVLATSFASVYASFVPEGQDDGRLSAGSSRPLGVIVEDDVAQELLRDGLIEGLGGESAATTEFRATSTSTYEGWVEGDASAIVCLPIPNTSGWELTVDGAAVKTFRADYGLIGFVVDEGRHDVVAHYRPPALGLGIAVTTLGLGTLVAVCTWMRSRQRRTPASRHLRVPEG